MSSVTELAPDIQNEGCHSAGPTNRKSLKARYCSALLHRSLHRRSHVMVQVAFDEPSHMLQEELRTAGAPDSLNCSNEYRHSCMPPVFDGCDHLRDSGIRPQLPELPDKESHHRRFTKGKQFVEHRRQLGLLD